MGLERDTHLTIIRHCDILYNTKAIRDEVTSVKCWGLYTYLGWENSVLGKKENAEKVGIEHRHLIRFRCNV